MKINDPYTLGGMRLHEFRGGARRGISLFEVKDEEFLDRAGIEKNEA